MGLGTRRGRGWISGLKIPLKPLFWHKPPSHTDVIISSSYLTSTTTQTYDKHICCQHIITISSQWVFIDKTTQQLQKLFKVSFWFWVRTHFKKSCCHVASWHNAMFLERALIDVSVLISKAFPKFLIVYSCEFGFVLEHNFPLVFSLNASLEKTILPELIYPGPFIFFLWFLISSHRKSFSLSFPQLSHFCPYQTFHRWNHSIATISIPNIKFRKR